MRGFILIAALALTGFGPASIDGGIDCRQSRWSDGSPAINLRHIFCGEIRGHADGYHSEALGPTPVVVGVTDRSDRGRGIYNATVLFADGERKFSTFYPRDCTVGQIVASVRYAVSQPPLQRRGSWGMIGPSAPDGAQRGGGFCLDTDGRSFPIRYARLSRGDVNTAFPDVP